MESVNNVKSAAAWMLANKIPTMSPVTSAVMRAIVSAIGIVGPPANPDVKRIVGKFARALEVAETIGTIQSTEKLRRDRGGK